MTLRTALNLCEEEVAELRVKVADLYFARQADVAALQAEVNDMLDLIEDLTIQGCSIDAEGLVDSMALSTYAESLRLLAEKGRYEIVAEYGRRVIAKRVDHG